MEQLDEIIELFKPMMSRFGKLGKDDYICIFSDDEESATEFVDTLEKSDIPVAAFKAGVYVRVTIR